MVALFNLPFIMILHIIAAFAEDTQVVLTEQAENATAYVSNVKQIFGWFNIIE